MADYQRILSYLYRYEKSEKKNVLDLLRQSKNQLFLS